ncbi:MAG: hypothetical protein AMXMBFR44_1800 [Candidatus Campbellbacteria bacterium]
MTEQRKNILLYTLPVVSLLLLVLDRVAQDNFFYWTYWWYDIMMHFLGGFLVAGIALWFFVRFFRTEHTKAFHALIVAVLSVLTVGLGWEYFEFFSGSLSLQEGSVIGDTALDLVMDTLGALCMWLVVSAAFFFRPRITNKTL